MIPLIATVKEMENQAAIVRRVAEEVFRRRVKGGLPGGDHDRVAASCAGCGRDRQGGRVLFSFGTNDLTQTTFGFSRDDVNKMLPTYIEEGIIKQDPFAAIDRDGVGELVRMESNVDARPVPISKLEFAASTAANLRRSNSATRWEWTMSRARRFAC